jgi:hypothetical protein
MIVLLVLLQLKHFICDFPLQGPYQYLNKGTYGHLGGVLHAFIHGIATFIILDIFVDEYNSYLVPLLSLLEMVAHYHIDWAKMTINKYYGWKCDSSEKFWYLLGFDQLRHQLTYIAIIYLAF